MGINSSAVILGNSVPPQQSDAGQGPQTSSTTDPGSQDASGAASGTDASASLSAGQKAAGPSPQTRSSARSARARSNAAGPTSNPVGADSQTAVPQPTTNFGSVMASALGRTAAGGKDLATPVTVPVAASAKPTDSSDSTGLATAAPQGQPSQSGADAVTWFAQAMMPPATGAVALPSSATGTGAPGSVGTTGAAYTGLPSDPSAAAADAQTVAGLTAQLAAQNTAAAGQSPRTAANAARTAAAADSSAPQLAPSSDAQSAAPAAGPINLSALAGVQKLISGLTGADTADTDTDASTPTTHAATAGSSSDDAQAAAALQATSLSHPNGALGAATLTIHAPVGSAAFADEVSARVTGLAQSGITQAQLQLNPADLGPVQVHITMQAGQASVWFGATHADTRAALEQSLPRLRELFAGAGMALTDSGVFREPPQQQQAQSLAAASSARSTLSETQAASTVTQVTNVRLSLLDTYA